MRQRNSLFLINEIKVTGKLDFFIAKNDSSIVLIEKWKSIKTSEKNNFEETPLSKRQYSCC